MDDIYENIEESNTDKDRKILIAFGGVIADMLSKIKLNPIVTDTDTDSSDTGLKSKSLQKMHCKTILFFSDS